MLMGNKLSKQIWNANILSLAKYLFKKNYFLRLLELQK